MAQGLGATVTLLQQLPGAWGRRAALLRVAVAAAQEAGHMDLRIVVAGSVDAGKVGRDRERGGRQPEARVQGT